MTDAEAWLHENTFFCPTLNARITPKQCRLNREREETKEWNSPTRTEKGPLACLTCTRWEEYQSEMTKQEETKEEKKTETAQEVASTDWQRVRPRSLRSRSGLVAWFDAKSNLTITADVEDKYKIKDGDQFHLYFDPDQNRIGLKKINYLDPDAFTFRKRGGTRKVCMTEIARRAKPKVGEAFFVEDKDGMLCVTITKTQEKPPQRKR